MPYTHGIRLQQALDKAGVPNQHVTIPGGKHGGFTDAEMTSLATGVAQTIARRLDAPPAVPHCPGALEC